MGTHNKIYGVITPLITPLTDTEELDEECFRALIERQITAGVRGLFCLGSSGEFVRLRVQVRRRVIQMTCEQAGDRIPVFVGVGDAGTNLVMRMSRIL